MFIDKAIKTIQAYCEKHDCDKCKYSNYGDCCCVFKNNVPCDWIDDIKRMQSEE